MYTHILYIFIQSSLRVRMPIIMYIYINTSWSKLLFFFHFGRPKQYDCGPLSGEEPYCRDIVPARMRRHIILLHAPSLLIHNMHIHQLFVCVCVCTIGPVYLQYDIRITVYTIACITL